MKYPKKNNPHRKKLSTTAAASLSAYFPIIRSRQEIIHIIHSQKDLKSVFHSWSQEDRENFLNCCTGNRGIKVLYDGIFKEVFNPESSPERLEDILSLLFQKKVKINTVLPNDTVRLGAESSLLYTDIIVQFRQHSDTGLSLNLLQEYYFIPLDIFRKNMEKVMNMYSKELMELDHNTVLYMIDEMQEQIDLKKMELMEVEVQLNQKNAQINQQEIVIRSLQEQLSALKNQK